MFCFCFVFLCFCFVVVFVVVVVVVIVVLFCVCVLVLFCFVFLPLAGYLTSQCGFSLEKREGKQMAKLETFRLFETRQVVF